MKDDKQENRDKHHAAMAKAWDDEIAAIPGNVTPNPDPDADGQAGDAEVDPTSAGATPKVRAGEETPADDDAGDDLASDSNEAPPTEDDASTPAGPDTNELQSRLDQRQRDLDAREQRQIEAEQRNTALLTEIKALQAQQTKATPSAQAASISAQLDLIEAAIAAEEDPLEKETKRATFKPIIAALKSQAAENANLRSEVNQLIEKNTVAEFMAQRDALKQKHPILGRDAIWNEAVTVAKQRGLPLAVVAQQAEDYYKERFPDDPMFKPKAAAPKGTPATVTPITKKVAARPTPPMPKQGGGGVAPNAGKEKRVYTPAEQKARMVKALG